MGDGVIRISPVQFFRKEIMRNNPDDLANQILEKVKDMLEINTRVNWDSAEIEPNEEFQNILDEIEKMENQ